MDKSPALFCAAMVTSPHGLHGHVRVKCFLENPQDLKTYSPFYAESGEEIFTIKKILSQHDDLLLVSLEGVEDRTQAEALRGTKLMLPQKSLHSLPEDTFYHQDLLTLPLLCPNEEKMGTVYALHNFGAGDIIEIKLMTGKLVMLPFLKDFIPIVDVASGFLILSPSGVEALKHG